MQRGQLTGGVGCCGELGRMCVGAELGYVLRQAEMALGFFASLGWVWAGSGLG